MPERDWSKELAKIDKQLESMSDEELAPRDIARASEPRARTPEGAAGRAAPPAQPAPATGKQKPAKAPRETGSFGVFARLTLSVVLGVGIVLWPYEATCGLGLAAYLSAVTVVAVSGGWSAVWTWRHRAARAHVLSLLILLWGLVLGSLQVLPRIGYAKPDLHHPTGWMCQSAPVARPNP